MKYPNLNKWSKRFIELAYSVAKWSKDPERKVGCVLVSPGQHNFSFGYNGFPAGIKDNDRLNDEIKNSLCVHAELNAILNARHDLTGWTAYITAPPCAECCKAMIQAGLHTVYSPPVETKSSWTESQAIGLDLLIESGVIVNHFDEHLGQENKLVTDDSGAPCPHLNVDRNLANYRTYCLDCKMEITE